jgi:hypothetical protein
MIAGIRFRPTSLAKGNGFVGTRAFKAPPGQAALARSVLAPIDRHMTARIANAPARQAFPSACVNYDT